MTRRLAALLGRPYYVGTRRVGRPVVVAARSYVQAAEKPANRIRSGFDPIHLCVHGLIRCDAHAYRPGAAQVRWTQHTKQMPVIERTQR